MSSFRPIVLFFFGLVLTTNVAIADATKAILVEPVATAPGKRIALMVGNATYGQQSENGIIVPSLTNPLNDARAVRDALRKLGFRVVYGEDLTKKELERAIGTFASIVSGADVAITYFSGHGSTFGDVPYLVPVDAEFDSLDSIPYELVKVEDFIGELRKAKGVRIALIDACRDNDADTALKSTGKSRGIGQTKGLARVADPDGLIIVYATQYLKTASDGVGKNSPFAASLVERIATPGEDVKNVLFDVAKDVVSRTNGEQRPEVSVSLYDSFVLNPAGPATENPPSDSTPVVADRPAEVTDPIATDYKAASDIGTSEALDLFLKKYDAYPDNFYVGLAKQGRLKLAALSSPAVVAAPLVSAKQAKMVLVPKFLGIVPFDQAHQGALEAEKELKNPSALQFLGPTPESSVAGQIQIVANAAAQGVGAILLSNNAGDQIVPAVKAAHDKGIKIVTWDSPIPSGESEDLFVAQVDFAETGKVMADMALKILGGNGGKFAILSASPDAANQNSWINAFHDVLKADPKYAKLQEVDLVYGNDQSETSYNQALALVDKHPDMQLIMAPTSVGIVAAAKAMQDEKLCDKVKVSGLGVPGEMVAYTMNGCAPEFALWSFDDLGYLVYYTAYGLATGAFEAKEGVKFKAGHLGEYTIAKDPNRSKGLRIVMGPFSIYDKSNVQAAAK
jgi:rhamnose transport system substrate-binding protein